MIGTLSPAVADFPNSSKMALASKPRAVKASNFGSEGWRFESVRAHLFKGIQTN